MLEQPEFLAALAGIAGALVAIFKAAQWFHRNISPRIQHAIKRYVDVCALEDSLTEIQGTNAELLQGLNQLLSEIRPNGGSSLRDAINRIEHRQILLDERSKAMMHEENKAMFETDMEGNYIWVNRRFMRLTGRTMEEILGHGWVNVVHADDRDDVNVSWYLSVSEERTFMREFRIIHPDNGPKLVSAVSYVLRGADGKPLGFLGVIKEKKEHDGAPISY